MMGIRNLLQVARLVTIWGAALIALPTSAFAANTWVPGAVWGGSTYPCPNGNLFDIAYSVFPTSTPSNFITNLRAACGGDYTGFTATNVCYTVSSGVNAGHTVCNPDDTDGGFYHLYAGYTSSEPGNPDDGGGSGEPEEPTCGELQGKTFPLNNPNDLALESGQSAAGYDYGCEFRIANCRPGAGCTGCYSGNGTKHPEGEVGRQWVQYPLQVGSPQPVSTVCPANPTPIGHPGYCEPSNPLYDARTGSCPPTTPTPTKDCDDPTWTSAEPCTWVANGGANAGTVPLPYEPPNPTPPPPPEYIENDGSTGLPGTPTIPPIDGGGVTPPGDINGNLGGGYTGGGGSESTVDTGSVSWGAFPSIPAGGFYTREYPGGVSGVVSDKLNEMTSTPLFTYMSSFRIADGYGFKPEFTVNLTGIGMGVMSFNIFEADYFWQIAKIVCIISALLLCRRLIFGG